MAMSPITVPGSESPAQAANSTAAAKGNEPSSSANLSPQASQSSPTGQVLPNSTETGSGKTIAVILCLFFIYPLGVILMYVLTKWKWWVKLLLTLPAVLFVVGIAAAVALIAINPEAQVQKAECLNSCQNSSDIQSCVTQCIQMPDAVIPSGQTEEVFDLETSDSESTSAGGTYLEGEAPEEMPASELKSN